MERPEAATDLQSVHDGHGIVDDHNVRPGFQGQRDGLLTIGRFSAYDPVGARFNDRAKPGTHDFMIIRNHDPFHGVVPVCRQRPSKRSAEVTGRKVERSY
jgi:hypothetical protein